MQSSAMVAIRTMIMITCLVAVPLAAVFGTALPKVVKTALGIRSHEVTWNDPHSDEEPKPPSVLSVEDFASSPHAEAGLPLNAGGPASRLPTAHITDVRPIDDTASAEAAVETAPLWRPPARTAQVLTERNTTAQFAPAPSAAHVDVAARHGEPRTEALQKTVYSQPSRDPDEDESLDEPEYNRLVPIERPASDNALSEGERQLRQLGATYFRLETWGVEGNLYRCSCNVALKPGSRATRHFQAIEAAPSQAIGAVIKQVDAWRARTQTTSD